MRRKFIDCRQIPSEMNCTIAISADSEAELLDAAVQHAVAVHRHEDTPELRAQIRSAIRDGPPPEDPIDVGQSRTTDAVGPFVQATVTAVTETPAFSPAGASFNVGRYLAAPAGTKGLVMTVLLLAQLGPLVGSAIAPLSGV